MIYFIGCLYGCEPLTPKGLIHTLNTRNFIQATNLKYPAFSGWKRRVLCIKNLLIPQKVGIKAVSTHRINQEAEINSPRRVIVKIINLKAPATVVTFINPAKRIIGPPDSKEELIHQSIIIQNISRKLLQPLT